MTIIEAINDWADKQAEAAKAAKKVAKVAEQIAAKTEGIPAPAALNVAEDAPEAPAATEVKEEVTLVMVRELLAELNGAGKAEQVRELITSYGVKKLSAITDPAQLADIFEKAKKL